MEADLRAEIVFGRYERNGPEPLPNDVGFFRYCSWTGPSQGEQCWYPPLPGGRYFLRNVSSVRLVLNGLHYCWTRLRPVSIEQAGHQLHDSGSDAFTAFYE
jgi:hypothetical protein